MKGANSLCVFFLSILPHSFWRHFHNPCLRFVSFLRLFPVRSGLAGGELSIVHTSFFGPQTFFSLFFPLTISTFPSCFPSCFPIFSLLLELETLTESLLLAGCVLLWLAGWLAGSQIEQSAVVHRRSILCTCLLGLATPDIFSIRLL